MKELVNLKNRIGQNEPIKPKPNEENVLEKIKENGFKVKLAVGSEGEAILSIKFFLFKAKVSLGYLWT